MRKQQIISEIKRTAAANGGVPLGQNRFFSETGIKVSAWRGRYWARWSDALSEAGFEANTMQQPYDETQLLDHYINMARELGRLPTLSEIDLRHREDESLPTTNAYRKFGSKGQLAARILEYAEQKPELADVINVCAPLAAKAEPPESGLSSANQAEDGFVYLIRSGRHFKIGKTNAVGRRERELAIQLPEPTKRVHVIRTDDPTGIERYWHDRFADRRKSGEWFELTPADVKAFMRRKFM
jgi:hypothetical protein